VRVVLLPGDCIGPEITAEARRVLSVLASDVELVEAPFGASARSPFPGTWFISRRMPSGSSKSTE